MVKFKYKGESMGTDIHALVECKPKDAPWWYCAGDPMIDRNYALFSIISGLRYENTEQIAPQRIFVSRGDEVDYDEVDKIILLDNRESTKYADVPNNWFKYGVRAYTGDGHNHSYVTLNELQKYHTKALILTNMIYTDEIERLISFMVEVKKLYRVESNDDIRLVFFFDS